MQSLPGRWPVPLVAVALLLPAVARTEPSSEPPTLPGTVFVSVGPDNQIEVSFVGPDNQKELTARPGLLVWDEGDGSERWKVMPRGWKPPEQGATQADEVPAVGVTRGSGGVAGPAGAAGLTRQLDPLRAGLFARGGGLLTPFNNSRSLTATPTFRRGADDRSAPYPEKSLTLAPLKGAWKATVPFRQGKDRALFSELHGLPAGIAEKGLPAGAYRITGGGDPVTFTVETEEVRRQVLEPIDDMGNLLRDASSPLYLQFALEHFLSFKEKDKPLADYHADALDLLNRAPAGNLTPYLAGQRARLIERLEKQNDTTAPPRIIPTGVAGIDRALASIAVGQWDQAGKALAGADLEAAARKDQRVRGLLALYRGVALAESGALREAEARQSFEVALADLRQGKPADVYRAFANAADFYQGLAENRLYNHAFQMATGARLPFITLLSDWKQARKSYEVAEAAAGKLEQPGPAVASIRAAQARLYGLLADVVQTLGGFEAGEQAAARAADGLAQKVTADSKANPLDRALAEEIRAQLLFRDSQPKALRAARARAGRALEGYLAEGQLPAVENVYRLLGLADARKAEKATGPAAVEARKEALRNLQVAYRLTEVLRRRMPAREAGTSRAGFLARKAFVTDKIAELLLEAGSAAEALAYVELGKARALGDLQRVRAGAARDQVPNTARLLANWPREAAALEYFLGPRHCWVLVVTTSGKVQAFRLKDGKGQDVAPRALVARVQGFLRGMNHYNKQMCQRLMTQRSYDHTWQDELHELFNLLVPPAALAELRKADRVVVVPQHILHYFPFAALVTRTDTSKPGKLKMVKPAFLVEERFTLVQAPSLAGWRARPARTVRQVNAIGLSEVPGADALEGVKRDVKNLQAAFGRAVTVLEGDAATKPAVRKLLGRAGMLFFGTHGINEADRPLDSHLMLQPDAEGTTTGSNLTAAEIFAANVTADLVVLSACYSGLGDRSPLPGDDLFGLQRAFLAAGARTVVSGLWDVFDETAPDLMNELFAGLLKGKGVAEALAGSQRAFLARYKAPSSKEPYYVHPYFWAVYTACGDDRTKWAR
jgi:CHAT domain-containing protein